MLVLWGAVLLTWARASVFDISRPLDPSKAGLFGDSFGAVNALFSGLALVGVAYAVVLQHEELEAARQDASDSEAAREKMEAALSMQAAIQVATAKLQAANSLAQTYRALEDLNAGRGDPYRSTEKGQVRRYCQLQEICLVELAHLERCAREGIVTFIDPCKAFLLRYAKAREREFTENWSSFPASLARQFIMETNEQVWLLTQQDLTLGTPFGDDLRGAAAQWSDVASFTQDIKANADKLRQDVFDAICTLHRIAER